ncbi:hypothetical protein [Streptomyces sp. NPDC057199]|uniref:hypothetical protein n=1 Tax=Streptomyces sp. NPDC057199 TaxID=3346047 RepID=UPI0036340DC5
MGAIRNLIQSVNAASESATEQKALIETLAKLAEAKANYFQLELTQKLRTAGSEENLTIPVETVLDTTVATHAFSSEDSGAIGDTVKSALKSFLSGGEGKVIEGIGSLISDATGIFLGDASASESTLRETYVTIEGYSVVRIDISAWKMNVQAMGITQLTETVSAFVAAKSAVDMSKIGFSTFLNVYRSQLADVLNPDEVLTALRQAKKIFEEFYPQAIHPASSSTQALG